LEVASEDLLECNNLTDLVSVGTKNIIFSSKGDARKAIQGNALSVNKVKVTDPQTDWKSIDKIRGKYVLVGNGKQKNYLLLFK
jgi:tyrosyl-tRNA synthetase